MDCEVSGGFPKEATMSWDLKDEQASVGSRSRKNIPGKWKSTIKGPVAQGRMMGMMAAKKVIALELSEWWERSMKFQYDADRGHTLPCGTAQGTYARALSLTFHITTGSFPSGYPLAQIIWPLGQCWF